MGIDGRFVDAFSADELLTFLVEQGWHEAWVDFNKDADAAQEWARENLQGSWHSRWRRFVIRNSEDVVAFCLVWS